MSLPNVAESKTQRARRDQEGSQHGSDSNDHRGTGYSSTTVGYQSVGANRANWKGANVSNEPGEIAGGGILTQLIHETSEQLAEVEMQREKLSERLQGLNSLLEQLTTTEEQ